jgi:hypothetical protein
MPPIISTLFDLPITLMRYEPKNTPASFGVRCIHYPTPWRPFTFIIGFIHTVFVVIRVILLPYGCWRITVVD